MKMLPSASADGAFTDSQRQLNVRERTMSENRKELIDQGTMQTRNLAECLAVDQRALVANIAAQLEPSLAEALHEAAQCSRKLGISKQIATIGLALGQWLEGAAPASRDQQQAILFNHPSDTVRGWATFANAFALRGAPSERALHSQLRFATDSHFGVREWAWLALRPQLAGDLQNSLALLQRHSNNGDPLIRRFCIEILRPRGVWCEHIARLKSEPEIAEALLIPLLAETDKYPQDSVANWLNDASKTRPDWVSQLFERYPPQCKAATRIFTRATRSLPVNA
jgi:3-methyladenine DNA glycosylase AlkC